MEQRIYVDYSSKMMILQDDDDDEPAKRYVWSSVYVDSSSKMKVVMTMTMSWDMYGAAYICRRPHHDAAQVAPGPHTDCACSRTVQTL